MVNNMPPLAFVWVNKWVAEMSTKEIMYGANPYQYVQYGGVAQLVEQTSHTRKVAGSIPAAATMF